MKIEVIGCIIGVLGFIFGIYQFYLKRKDQKRQDQENKYTPLIDLLNSYKALLFEFVVKTNKKLNEELDNHIQLQTESDNVSNCCKLCENEFNLLQIAFSEGEKNSTDECHKISSRLKELEYNIQNIKSRNIILQQKSDEYAENPNKLIDVTEVFETKLEKYSHLASKVSGFDLFVSPEVKKDVILLDEQTVKLSILLSKFKKDIHKYSEIDSMTLKILYKIVELLSTIKKQIK